ncbi:heat shock protein 67B1 [Drosophila ficusphila]|uniref:heat shock protein 67B1 n=1 Tax=Drosophila ficusphila TaxID=30025 RepID=UPI0007E797A2|nr:heat shock protein 67B1 [Drosophila ficusphila]
MSLIPFILDLAEELHDFNRSLAMDIDDSSGFGLYPLEASSQLHAPQMSRSLGRGNAMMWVPIKGQSPVQQHRHHPYNRVAGAKTVCCNKSLLELEKELGDKGTSGGGGGSSSQPTASKSAYSVVNRNGFQVSMNVKQFAANELTVKTIDNCIVVEGQHDEKEDGHGVISRHFIRKYILPKGYDPNEVHSTLSSDGILTVKAPPPLPVAKGNLERQERIVDIQQISQQQKEKDAQPPKPAEQLEQQAVANAPSSTTSAPTPTPPIAPTPSLSLTLAESNGNGQVEPETGIEMESSEVTALSPSLSNEAAAAVEAPSTAGTTSSANNGVAEPESMEVVAKNDEAAKVEEQEPTPTPTPDPVMSSEGELKAEDANANEVAIASNNGNGAAAITPEDVEMPLAKKPEIPSEESKEEKVEKLEKVEKVEEKGGEELAAVDAAILLAKNQGENGATAAKTEELAK